MVFVIAFLIVATGFQLPQKRVNPITKTVSAIDTDDKLVNDSDNDGLTDDEEIKLGTNPNVADTDLDGLLDGAEVYIYHTNPLKESTDGDRYDDGQEILGTSPYGLGEFGGDMPGYVLSPGDNPFVAAYPIIDFDISDKIDIDTLEQITTAHTIINISSFSYSVSETEGYSISRGKTETHTINKWQEISNEPADKKKAEENFEKLNEEEMLYTVVTLLGKSITSYEGASEKSYNEKEIGNGKLSKDHSVKDFSIKYSKNLQTLNIKDDILNNYYTTTYENIRYSDALETVYLETKSIPDKSSEALVGLLGIGLGLAGTLLSCGTLTIAGAIFSAAGVIIKLDSSDEVKELQYKTLLQHIENKETQYINEGEDAEDRFNRENNILVKLKKINEDGKKYRLEKFKSATGFASASPLTAYELSKILFKQLPLILVPIFIPFTITTTTKEISQISDKTDKIISQTVGMPDYIIVPNNIDAITSIFSEEEETSIGGFGGGMGGGGGGFRNGVSAPSSIQTELTKTGALIDPTGTLDVYMGNSIDAEHVIGSAIVDGRGEEVSFSTTILRTRYHETTVTNIHTITTGEEWTTATCIDTGRAARMRFTFFLENRGTDIARDIRDIRFNIFIGNSTIPITYPSIDESGFSLSNLAPGERLQFSGDIILSLDELRAVDEGEPIKIRLADYNYGSDELYYESAFGNGVLFEIDNGVWDGDDEIQSFLIPVEENETYLDVLSKYVPVDYNGTVVNSIWNLPINETSYWSIFMSKYPEREFFVTEKAKPHTRVFLRYLQDSDGDGFTNREEIAIGTDPHNALSTPYAKICVTTNSKINGSNVTVHVKFSNVGNYDAYGIEARLISPDNSTMIIDGRVGGSGRLGPTKSIYPNFDTFEFKILDQNFSKPILLLTYNDPLGNHRYISSINLCNLSSIKFNISNMIEEYGLFSYTSSMYGYNESNPLLISYYNPTDTIIKEAKYIVSYQTIDGGIIWEHNMTVNLLPGYNPIITNMTPSDFLTNLSIGYPMKVVVFLTDYQGIIIDSSIQHMVIASSKNETDIDPDAKIIVSPSEWNINARVGESVNKSFTVFNIGKNILHIFVKSDLNITCRSNCFNETEAHLLILPGSSERINILLDTSHSKILNDSIYFYTSDPENPFIKINLTGTIGPPDDIGLNFNDISFSNNHPSEGENITIYATIHNYRNTSVMNVTIQFFDGYPGYGGKQIGSNHIINLIESESSVIVSQHLIYNSTIHDIYVIIDPSDQIIECNEYNNLAIGVLNTTLNPSTIATISGYEAVELTANYSLSGNIKIEDNGILLINGSRIQISSGKKLEIFDNGTLMLVNDGNLSTDKIYVYDNGKLILHEGEAIIEKLSVQSLSPTYLENMNVKGSYLNISASEIYMVNSITNFTGKDGNNGAGYGGNGYPGENVYFNISSQLETDIINCSLYVASGNGGNGAGAADYYINGGNGGNGGRISSKLVSKSILKIIDTKLKFVSGNGGNGGTGGPRHKGGDGGDGGHIILEINSSDELLISNSAISILSGNGGNGNTVYPIGEDGWGGDGGHGGNITFCLTTTSVIVSNSSVDIHNGNGGDGGRGGSGSSTAWAGGNGGNGGDGGTSNFSVHSIFIKLNNKNKLTFSSGDGGDGGDGGSDDGEHTGNGGDGGDGGDIKINIYEGLNINLNEWLLEVGEGGLHGISPPPSGSATQGSDGNDGFNGTKLLFISNGNGKEILENTIFPFDKIFYFNDLHKIEAYFYWDKDNPKKIDDAFDIPNPVGYHTLHLYGTGEKISLSCILNYTILDSTSDEDGDELENLLEYSFGINPLSNDTDNDSLSDYFELINDFDPCNEDSDYDGVIDNLDIEYLDPPDFVVNEIYTTETNIVEGDVVTLYANITNIGNSSGKNFTVSFFIGDPEVDRSIISHIACSGELVPNSSTIIECKWNTKGCAGSNNIYAIVDTRNNIYEANESNNFNITNINIHPKPDLFPINLFFKPNNTGDSVDIFCHIKNKGSNSTGFVVKFYDGNPIVNATLIGINEISSLQTNSSVISYIKWNGSSGLHNIYVAVDESNNIIESNESNNIINMTIFIPYLPDLKIDPSDIRISDYSLTEEDIVWINATAHNIGNADAENVTISIYADTTHITDIIIPWINAFANQNISFKWVAVKHTHQIRILVDMGNIIPEINESNNEAFINISVKTKADLTPQSIGFSKQNPMEKDRITISSSIMNKGETDAYNVIVRLLIDSSIVSETTFDIIPANESRSIFVEWNPEAGSHEIKIITDPDNIINEINESNNEIISPIEISAQPPYVKLFSPNGGENLIKNHSHVITWEAKGDLGAYPISLYYSANGGITWTLIVSNISNNGYYSWVVPNIETANALIKISCKDIYGNLINDSSDLTFAIDPPFEGNNRISDINLITHNERKISDKNWYYPNVPVVMSIWVLIMGAIFIIWYHRRKKVR